MDKGYVKIGNNLYIDKYNYDNLVKVTLPAGGKVVASKTGSTLLETMGATVEPFDGCAYTGAFMTLTVPTPRRGRMARSSVMGSAGRGDLYLFPYSLETLDTTVMELRTMGERLLIEGCK